MPVIPALRPEQHNAVALAPVVIGEVPSAGGVKPHQRLHPAWSVKVGPLITEAQMHFDHAATDGLDIQHAGVAAQVTRDPFAAIAFDLGLAIGMPASGYYEWKTTPEGKQPYYFTRITPVMLCSATANAAANSSSFIEPIPLLAAAEVATCQ